MKVALLNPAHQVTYDGATINVYHADKGQGLPRHEHVYAHLTMCHAGSCVIRKEGKEYIFTKDTQPANFVANEWHEIEALEDGTVFVNVFAEGKY
jgi:quercetin dioxygenase-like cupin family protein